ncbi:MAG: phosphate/phosphite/phosphonate ABC transporter substrate-binding protein [Proteobacteria bacterium]|nr:phosphate/phosphite/phosphonate ABC transporter substrate-binding protein [Pseudomonadota bacterium]MBU1419639.1 phosphate/phosphite/phosphonate ABC transporter substrate-binding protein [Pseudomonadota bacterium]MBU1453430.1 phosphate/phosphite/phosphonate ABC transporter substrate-binding protein [Pseudomonadota bacterium]
MKNIFSLTLILLCFSCGFVQAEEYKLSMLPRYFPEKLNAMLKPLAAYLSQETGYKIESVLTDNFASYEAEVLKNNIDIGYENPLVYVNVSTSHKVIAIAVKGEGGDKFRGIIISRPDSGITKLAHLKGKKVMIVSNSSAGGFLSQKMTLMKNGLDVYRDCELIEAAENRQENVVISVSVGDVDAGFIRESALHMADEFIMPGSVQTVIETAWLPNWALSVSRDMPQQQQEAIQKAILKLSRDSTVLQAMGLTAFVAATDSDYDIMRELVK